MNNDFKSGTTTTKVHLFSNILDIDLFSMNDLIKLIKSNFLGKNIFVCVSPFVSTFKTERINGFVESFSNNLNFELIYNISEKNGEWGGTNWSRVVRVFKCEL